MMMHYYESTLSFYLSISVLVNTQRLLTNCTMSELHYTSFNN